MSEELNNSDVELIEEFQMHYITLHYMMTDSVMEVKFLLLFSIHTMNSVLLLLFSFFAFERANSYTASR